MINPSKLEEIARQIADSVPTGVKQFAGDVETQAKTVLQSQLSKLDLVTREEFDVQNRVLLKTREKLEQLEATVAELEATLKSKD
ncbi:ubiquinone biosynthesis accessory factor UbiK [Echinimonas agarilytica]|uniref:Ubiquinone biosynthesis accessory factor UbiK n=1 Tax=Echinimonas agarilytica TaxID=1215918 RepID=A0AA41W3P0_9GAMM|nr:accessory factor UbiK family protein [Echinimonas agarilytica]MCM2678210.1 accessory factor UbiK family protein [Echinimonas agarilytica]